jgi:hypothetical protein
MSCISTIVSLLRKAPVLTKDSSLFSILQYQCFVWQISFRESHSVVRVGFDFYHFVIGQ